MTIEEKLQHLQTAALEDARTQGNTIISEQQKALHDLYEEYKKQKLAQACMTVKTETENARHKANKALAGEQLKVRHKITRRTAELKTQLFEEVRIGLEQFKSSPKYAELLLSQALKAKEFAKGSEVNLYIDPSDADQQETLQNAAGIPVYISEESFGGGTRAIIPGKNILIEESFDAKLKQAYEDFTFDGGISHD